jgi:hypothetical protein
VTDTATTDVMPFQGGTLDRAEQAHLNSIWRQAQTLARMNLLSPELRNNVESVFGVILFGEQYGLSPAQAVSQLWIIKGRIVPSSQVYAGVAMRAGHEVRIEESSSERCVVAIRRRGTDYWQRVTWTIEDAERAGLAKKEIWRQYPGDMLAHATMRRAVKRICADALLGIADVGDDGVAIDEYAAPAPAELVEEKVIDVSLDDDVVDGEVVDGDKPADAPAEQPPLEDPADAGDEIKNEHREKLQRQLMATATKTFPKDTSLLPAQQRARVTAQRHAVAYVALGRFVSASDMTEQELGKVLARLDDVQQRRLRIEDRDGSWWAIQGDRELPIPAEDEQAS